MSRFLSHAQLFDPDPEVEQLRSDLRDCLANPHAQGAWGFVLYARDHPGSNALPARVLGVVTLSDSLPLTHEMIARLPAQLWLAGAQGVVALLPLCDELQLHPEPVPAALVRFGAADDPNHVTRGISASDMAGAWVTFIAAGNRPPPGWPP